MPSRDSAGSEPRRGVRLAIALLVVTWVAFNAPAFVGRVLFPVDLDRSVAETGSPTGKISNPLDSDAYSLYYPLRVYMGDQLRSGDLPLWDPHRFGGTPFAANPQTAVWYPPNWVFAVADPLLAYSWILVLTRLAGLLLTYWFLRVLSLHPAAAAAGAVIFMGSGFLMAWGTHMTFPSSAVWLPLALGGLTRVYQGKVTIGVPLAATGLALSLLGGHPQVSLFVWLSAGLWTAVWTISSFLERRKVGVLSATRSALIPAAWAALAFVTALALGGLQLLALLDIGSTIVRGVEPVEGLLAGAPPLMHALTMLLPDRFGNPMDGNHIGPINYTEGAMYAGVLTLVLAVVAVWHRRDRATAAFTTIGVLGALTAFGTPLYLFLFRFVPGLSRLRGVGRFSFLLDVALAGLAAIGLDEVIRRPTQRRRIVLVAGVAVALALVVSVTVLNRGALPASYLGRRAVLAAIILVVGTGAVLVSARWSRTRTVVPIAVVIAIAVDLWAFGFRYHPFQPARPIQRESEAIRLVRSSPEIRPRLARLNHYWIPANGALTHSLYDIQGYDNFISTRYVQLVSLIEDQTENARSFNVIYNFSDPARLNSPIADLLGLRYVLASREEEGLGPPLTTGRYSIFARGSLPPAFLVHCWEVVPPGTASARMRHLSTDDLRSVALVDQGSNAPAALQGDCRPGPPASVNLYEPESVELTVDAPRPGLVVLTDVWDEGWTATVDGAPRSIVRADHALRGIFVGRGRHRIDMTYRPDWLRGGIFATALGLVVLVAFGGLWLWRVWFAPQPPGSQRKRYTPSISEPQSE